MARLRSVLRSAQARCTTFSVAVPDQAKSAATLLALGADQILMGPTSDLGPVDPQFLLGSTLVSAKSILAAVDQALVTIQTAPQTLPLHASLLADVNAIMVAEARAELDRSDQLIREALGCRKKHEAFDEEALEALAKRLHAPLVEEKSSHGAVFGSQDAVDVGLPVLQLQPQDEQWRRLWRLYTKYVAAGAPYRTAFYEGSRASQSLQIVQSPRDD